MQAEIGVHPWWAAAISGTRLQGKQGRTIMQAEIGVHPWWAALTIWGVVNAVNLLQAAGFFSRVITGSMRVNEILGRIIIALAIPTMAALFTFVRAGTGWLHRIGPIGFLAFVAFMTTVEYAWPVEFRSPRRASILVPYLLLFFGAIFLMGFPMFRMNRGLLLVTVATTALLLGSMGIAMSKGVG